MKKLTIILRTAALLLTASVLLLTHLASVAGEPKPSEVQQKFQELWKSAPKLTEQSIRGVKFQDAGFTNSPKVPGLREVNWAQDLTSRQKMELLLIDDPTPIRRQLQAIPAELNRGPHGEKFSVPRR